MRPRLPKHERRTHLFTVRLSDIEQEKLEKVSSRLLLPTSQAFRVWIESELERLFPKAKKGRRR